MLSIIMLEKPDVADAKIIECLQAEYGLKVNEITFLPLGADYYTVVYRAVADNGIAYFVKLRRGVFDEITVALPKALHDQGIRQIIAPLATRSGMLWATLENFRLALYPFVEGKNGFQVRLSDGQWAEFGRTLKTIHTAHLPEALASRIPRENYSGQWREMVRAFQAQIENSTFDDPVAAKLAAFLHSKRDDLDRLVGMAERLAAVLQARPEKFVLCHTDIHAANLLLTASGALYIVDWDNPLLAPPERDLMFVGGAQFGKWHTPEEEEALFYAGYGQTEVDAVALAYYHHERIVADIAAYCQEILLTSGDGEDREIGVTRVMNNFLPGATLEIAYRSEERLPPELRSG